MSMHTPTIKLSDKRFKLMIDRDTIQTAVDRLAIQINRDYEGENPLFIAVLNGAFMFAADFIKKITIRNQISFVKFASYEGDKSTGRVNELIGVNENLEGRHVVILEDIIDTGLTFEHMLEVFGKHKPASLKIVSLLLKPETYHHRIPIDYIGMEIPNKFVVGYGLDYNNMGRHFEDIYEVVE